MDLHAALEVKWNVEILGYNRGKKKCLHQRTHNIIVNNGRQFIIENISATSFAGAGFTRAQSSVVRYIGFGIGGNRQVSPLASQSPLADAYPGGYGGTNAASDSDVAVARLERPVKCTQTAWMKEVTAPPDYPSATSVRWTALFDVLDLNLAPYTTMPISEIGLFNSRADPTLPNGGVGTYPGVGTAMVAYDNFPTLPKTAYWSLLARWTWTI
jgi:hypothetical protein